jgi:hypothetical protein
VANGHVDFIGYSQFLSVHCAWNQLQEAFMRKSLLSALVIAAIAIGMHTTTPTVLAWCGPQSPDHCKQAAPTPTFEPVLRAIVSLLLTGATVV